MTRSALYTILGFAIAIAVAVAGFFLLEIEQIAIHIWALAFLILSLLVSMGSLVSILQRKAAAKDTVFHSAGTTAAVCVYQAVVLLSIAFTGAFNGKTGRFIFTEIAILAAFAVVMLAIGLSARYVHAANAKTLERQENGEHGAPKRGGF